MKAAFIALFLTVAWAVSLQASELKDLTKGLKAEYDKFEKVTTYSLPSSISSKPRRMTVELIKPDDGEAVIRLKAWLSIVRPNPPIRTQKLLILTGGEVAELACNDGNYKFIEGRASNFNSAVAALAGETASRPPDREEISDMEANKEVKAIIEKLSTTSKGQKVEVRFAGQQSNSEFKMEERDRALFAQLVGLRDHLNSAKKDSQAEKK